MPVTQIQTQATILAVARDSNLRSSVEAEIPALQSNRSFKYINWANSNGPAPNANTEIMGVFNPTARQKYYIENGTLTEGPIDGSEQSWQVRWELLSWEPLASSPAPIAETDLPWESEPQAATTGAFFVDKDRATIIREGNINYRHAVTAVIANEEPGNLTPQGIIDLAEPLANWMDNRLKVLLAGGLPEAAQNAGARVVEVVDAPTIQSVPLKVPNFTAFPELVVWTETQGYTAKQIKAVLAEHGYDSSQEYLADNKTVQGLAELLIQNLTTDSDSSW